MKINNKRLEKVAEKFTNLMIKRISEVNDDWSKPWLTVKRRNYLPRNISGRHYSGGNTLMLLIYSLYYDYQTPVFLTFLQAKNLNVSVKKGAFSFPVYHMAYMYYDYETRDRISIEKYEELPTGDKERYSLIPTPKCYDVFNLDQTNYDEKYPEEWSELLSCHRSDTRLNTEEIFTNAMLDTMLSDQSWICPIEEDFSNRAYYSPSEDKIVLPCKPQFKDGESFYTTALHEMTHSTGSQDRLKRIKKGAGKNTADYAKEELVAELSAALMGFYLGMETSLRTDHAAYLKYWLDALHKDNSFLMDVLTDVVQAVKFICIHLGFNPFESGGIQPGMFLQSKQNRTGVITAVPQDELVIID